MTDTLKGRKSPRRPTIDQMIAALTATKGMIAPAAKSLGMTRTALHDRVAVTPALQSVVHDERESMTDTAELALHRAIVNGEAWATCFYLKTQGKSRGYVERQEVTGANGGPIATTNGPDLSKLTTEELRAYHGLLSKASS